MKIKRISGRHCIAYTAFILISVFVLLIFNHIIAFCYNHTLAPSKQDVAKEVSSDVVLGLDKIMCENDLSESLLIRGWALCATEENNADKYFQITLKKNDAFYYYDQIAPHERPDLQIPGAMGFNHGFGFYASTLNLPAGIYEIFVYCHENDADYGMRSLNYLLVKNSSGIFVKKWCSQEVKLSIAEDQKFHIALDGASLTEDKAVSLYGWAYLPGVDSTKQKLYLEITDKNGVTRVYDTHQTRRTDLSKISEEAVQAGFNALLEPNSIPLGNITIRIILESGGQYYRSADTIQAVIGDRR